MINQVEEEFVNCLRASELLDVSVSTVKRMCDQQLLDCARTSGGHRRISLQSIARWLAFQRTQRETEGERFGQQTLDANRVVELLLSDSLDELCAMISLLRSEGHGMAEIIDDFLSPAQRRLRHLSELGSINLYQMQQCQTTIRNLLGSLTISQASNLESGVVAVGACVGPARHDIVSAGVALSIADTGGHAISLGARVSPTEIAQAARDYEAAMVWMNLAFVADPEQASRLTQELGSHLDPEQLVVICGCESWSLSRRNLVCDLVTDACTEIRGFVEKKLHPTQPDALANAG